MDGITRGLELFELSVLFKIGSCSKSLGFAVVGHDGSSTVAARVAMEVGILDGLLDCGVPVLSEDLRSVLDQYLRSRSS